MGLLYIPPFLVAVAVIAFSVSVVFDKATDRVTAHRERIRPAATPVRPIAVHRTRAVRDIVVARPSADLLKR